MPNVPSISIIYDEFENPIFREIVNTHTIHHVEKRNKTHNRTNGRKHETKYAWNWLTLFNALKAFFYR